MSQGNRDRPAGPSLGHGGEGAQPDHRRPDDRRGGHYEKARAKLTHSLKIVGRRPDGFHLIDAEMMTLDFADGLAFGRGDGLEVTDLIRTSTGRAESIPLGPENLINKALGLLGRKSLVHLDKRIPTGAGLGGGSADAAAVLRWGDCGDLELAAGVGADVPFCLVGGRARVTGIGEIVEPLAFEQRYFVLLVPPLRLSTPAVYSAWDQMGSPAHGRNDLEPAAVAVEPRMQAWKEALGQLTGLEPTLAGSGSTWFVDVGDPGRWPGDDAVEHLAWQGALLIRARTEPAGEGHPAKEGYPAEED